MKTNFFILLFTFILSFHSSAQDDFEIICLCEESAQFPGGDKALARYVAENLKLPSNVNENEFSHTRVYISFLVTEIGELKELEVERGIHPDVDEAFLDVFREMPNWIPASKGCSGSYKTYVRIPFYVELE